MFKFCELEQNTIVKYVSFLTQSRAEMLKKE